MKQIILIRTDLNMSVGKIVAQGAHASVGAYSKICLDSGDASTWIVSGATKICLRVETEDELKLIFEQALEVNLPAYLVKDAGRTELKASTYTAAAIGPASNDKIDAITGKLKLL